MKVDELLGKAVGKMGREVMRSGALTDAERRVLVLLKASRGLSCTEIGERIWGRPMGSRANALHARTAGKVLHALLRRALVRVTLDDSRNRFVWYAR